MTHYAKAGWQRHKLESVRPFFNEACKWKYRARSVGIFFWIPDLVCFADSSAMTAKVNYDTASKGGMSDP